MKNPLTKFLGITPYKIGVVITFAILGLYCLNLSCFGVLDSKVLDLALILKGKNAPGKETVIAAIDEKSCREIGQWPWPYPTMARLVKVLNQYGARAIAFDMVFPDQSGKIYGFHPDRELARSIKEAANVTLGYSFDLTPMSAGNRLLPGSGRIIASKFPIVQFRSMPQHTSLFEACSVVPNADAISDAAENEGYINVSPDADGVLRWAPLAIKMDRELYPSLALSALVQYLDWPVFSITLKDSGVEGIKLGDIDIPTDPLGRILINYRGPEKSFPHYSISDLLNDRIDADAIRDKIVLVGLSDQSLGTSRLTPYGTAYTDVEIQANVIDNILHGNIIRRPSWAGLFDLSSILLFGLILSAVFAKIHWFPSMLLSAALIVLVVSGGAYMLQAHGLWLSIAYPLLAIVATYLGVVISKGMIKKSQVTRT